MPRKYKYKVTSLNDSSCGNIPTKYRLLYKKGTIVYALVSTWGVMTFKRRQDAVGFINREQFNPHKVKIKKVIPIGRGSVPKCIAIWNIEEFYERLESEGKNTMEGMPPPVGTICYPGVFVCD